jgi:hypothetical protein
MTCGYSVSVSVRYLFLKCQSLTQFGFEEVFYEDQVVVNFVTLSIEYCGYRHGDV